MSGFTRIPVEVDYGSEFRYRDPILGPQVLTVLISQSGQAAGTAAALCAARDCGTRELAYADLRRTLVKDNVYFE